MLWEALLNQEKAVEVRVHWGDALLDVEHVSPARAKEIADSCEGGPLNCEVAPVVAVQRFGAARVDRAPWVYVGASLAFTSLLLLAASFLPPANSALSADHNAFASRSIRALMMESLPPTVEEPVARVEGESPVESAFEHALGRAGTTHEVTRPHRSDPHGQRQDVADHGERSAEVGALAALRSMSGSWDSASPFAGRAAGTDVLASLTGDRVGESFGFGGLSLSSTGRGAGLHGGTVELDVSGGGGTGWGSICGCGPMGLIGRGHGSGIATLASVEAPLPERESAVPDRIVRCGCGDLRIRGGLSKEVIRRVVRRHHGEVRHCYEQGLQQRPDLAGRVLTQFVIAPTGQVVAATVQSSTLGHSETEMCIARAARRWSFPAVDDGGVTNVTYPFVLESL